ncbi:nucleotide-diphospho-sugar transferase [Auricularia subglabra TFB-10046 SS5]|uniref:Translation initiation factor eIF2B subunit gamma n=1 Tax=Auricularia subglabra (strain TFB-10046 / SS5) TaxID=717982 RepID=J0CXP0_AURST|nr:nucleotide-diphospho-sugar transferase [Auricularia subglabra TFB-10046 SS5]
MSFAGTSSQPEFLAVIIVGFGEQLRPLTSNNGDEASPKAMLPVANKPLISFPLTWLEEAGVTDVLVLCPESHANAISNYLASDASSSSFPTLTIATHTFDDAYRTDPSKGPCTVLKQFAHKITSDFIILPCDFIPPPTLPLSSLLDKFRLDTDGLILASLFYQVPAPSERVALVPNDLFEDPPVVIYDEASCTLLQIDDSDDTEGEVDVRSAVLWQYPHAQLASDLVDSHVYVCRRCVLETLSAHRFQSIRADLLPWLIEVPTRAHRRRRWAPALGAVPRAARTTLEHSTGHLLHARNTDVATRGDDPESRAASPTDDGTAPEGSMRTTVLVHPLARGPALRANTLSALLEANRAALPQAGATFAAAQGQEVDPKAQLATNVLLGASSRIGERTTVKQSVIGAHCIIGKNVKISGSVLMDHCVVKDGAKIDGCILGARTSVGEKASLVQCFTQPGYEIADNEAIKAEKVDRMDEAWDEEDNGEEDASDDASD